MIRQPLVVLLGHVDHGKTTLADFIRGTTLAQREAGNITQAIGSSEVPSEVIKKICGSLIKENIVIPGILMIDTPGHSTFTNLRKRGGSIADLAVLIIDINQGIQPQTKEAIQILKTFKVPFVIAATKIDMLSGWKNHDKNFIKNLGMQIQSTKESYEKKFYNLLGQISELGFDSNIYNQISDYSKNVAIVPISAKTGEGVAELLAILTGLSQKFLKGKLEINEDAPAKGTILEIKDTKGMGTTADVIVYSGSLKFGDTIILPSKEKVFETKIRALLSPLPLSEIRDKKSQFKKVDQVVAASGIKILAPDLDKAIAGSPFASVRAGQDSSKTKKEIQEEIEDVLIETDEEGIILKADTLGSLEAATGLLKKNGIQIKKADIGDVTKQDIIEAATNLKTNPEFAFVLGFNVKISDGVKKIAEEEKISVITDQVIYKIQEKYEEDVKALKVKLELESAKGLTWPCKFKILPQYIFRQTNPAVFGIEVFAGKVRPEIEIMNKNGDVVGKVKNIEDSGEKLEELEPGRQAAISVKGITIGRNAKGGDELYSEIKEEHFRLFKTKAKKSLTRAEIQILKEIAQIKRKNKETWGV